MSAQLKNGKQTAAELGITPSSLCILVRDGVLTPEIHEGRLLRFDVAKVRRVLAKRAAEKAARRDTDPSNHMVPTF